MNGTGVVDPHYETVPLAVPFTADPPEWFGKEGQQTRYQFRGGPRHGEFIFLPLGQCLVRVQDVVGDDFWYETAVTSTGVNVLVPTCLQVIE